MRILEFFLSKIRGRNKWKMVYRHIVTVDSSGFIYFYFYETQTGKRKFEYHQVKTAFKVTDAKFYNTVVYPWLKGAYYTDIPSYGDMDTVNVIAKLQKP